VTGLATQLGAWAGRRRQRMKKDTIQYERGTCDGN